MVPGTEEEARAPLTISSIGSIPEPVPGIPQKGEVYTYADVKRGLLMDGATAVFAAGNVLTGKGNIKDSLDSGTEIGTMVAESYLGLTDVKLPLADAARKAADAEAKKVIEVMEARPVDRARTKSRRCSRRCASARKRWGTRGIIAPGSRKSHLPTCSDFPLRPRAKIAESK